VSSKRITAMVQNPRCAIRWCEWRMQAGFKHRVVVLHASLASPSPDHMIDAPAAGITEAAFTPLAPYSLLQLYSFIFT
jgi:hypothetical protein